MGSKKNKILKNRNGNVSISNSENRITSSSDATQKTREKGCATDEGLNDSTQSSF